MNFAEVAGALAVPVIIAVTVIAGAARKVKIYESFCSGAMQGVQLVIKILPFICAMTVATGLLRDSGLLNIAANALSEPLGKIGIPTELIPLILIRPFSGSAAMALLADIYTSTGVNSRASLTASLLMGSTETLFYTMGLYFGHVKIKKSRYAVAAAMCADFVAIIMAVLLTKYL